MKRERNRNGDSAASKIEIDFNTDEYYNLTFGPKAEAASAEAPPSTYDVKAEMARVRVELFRLNQSINHLKLPVVEAIGLDRFVSRMDAIEALLKSERQSLEEERLRSISRDFLPVLDSFDRLTEAASKLPEQAKSWLAGVVAIRNQVYHQLKRLGLDEMPLLREFDARYHLAVGTVERDDLPDSTIVRVHLKGYFFKGRLLRAAEVEVSRRPA
jgi:molecular chaperone GrpE